MLACADKRLALCSVSRQNYEKSEFSFRHYVNYSEGGGVLLAD